MTTPTKHTPGPWHIIHEPTLSTYHIRVEDLDAAPVASLFYSSGGSRPQLSRELIDANARLIAAAPDLLAACEAALSFGEGHPDRTPSWHDARLATQLTLRAAIAKAKGGVA